MKSIEKGKEMIISKPVNELTLGELKELREQLDEINQAGFHVGQLNTNEKKSSADGHWGWNICVLQRGFVIVGDVYKEGDWFTVKNCSCIRKWGTTKGLGQLALEGPLAETTLDKQTDTKFHELTSIELIPSEKSKWQ